VLYHFRRAFQRADFGDTGDVLAVAEDEPAPERRARRPGLITRIFRWMAQPI
jgi:hypothetical protein